MSNSTKFLSPTSSGKDIKMESIEDSTDCTGVEPWSGLKSCEHIEERTERKTGYLMSREQKDTLTNMKEEDEEEDWERQSLKMEREDGVRDEEGHRKEEEKKWDEQREEHVTDQAAKMDKLGNNGVKSEFKEQKVETLSTLVSSCLRKQPVVLIHRLEIADFSVPVPLSAKACKRGQGATRHELSPLRGNESLMQKKGQVMIQKKKTVGQSERPLKMLPSSSEDGICADVSLISPVISTRRKNTGLDCAGQTAEVSSQVFACSQCPFVHPEEVNVQQHIEKRWKQIRVSRE
ncbi:hypothetical protein ANANG_G00114660 [Anguilla anguilla]|uniref:Uncharacterized protein n=1 Tax=Anguilla anguilla TaxID=7936 RepID=A0A9D3MF86_ANGAN|nr:hypothetical protein ANANG_G00114660 [Anguilla anguilla]